MGHHTLRIIVPYILTLKGKSRINIKEDEIPQRKQNIDCPEACGKKRFFTGWGENTVIKKVEVPDSVIGAYCEIKEETKVKESRNPDICISTRASNGEWRYKKICKDRRK
jgi:hypothetical protein